MPKAGRHIASGQADDQDDRAIVAAERARARAFRQARRHTWLVRTLKLALPLVAVGALGTYGASLFASASLKRANVSVGSARIDPVNLTMVDPRYDGFAKDGSAYRVHAKSAITDFRMQKPVRLNVIDGELLQTNGVVTKLDAAWGTYDQKKDVLELYDRINVIGSDGMRARLTRATVWTKENRIASDQAVWAEMTTGTIQARAMQVDGKTRKAHFANDVIVTLKPKPAKPAIGEAAAQPPSPLPGLDFNSGAPVTIKSRTLDVDDNAHQALFRGTVVASQGEAQLAAPELDVLYEAADQANAKSAQEKAKLQAADVAAQSRLRKILARGGVVMSSRDSRAEGLALTYDAEAEVADLSGNVVLTQAPDRRATANTAHIDQKSDQILLTGQVVVTQAENVMRAERLAIDRKAATARFTSPAERGRPPGRISTLLHQKKADSRKRTAPATPEPAAGSNLASTFLGSGFRSSPDAPIDVSAATLDIFDRRHKAVYTGQVIAKQGNFVVATEVMTAHYTGETGLASDPRSVQEKAGRQAVKAAPDLTRIEARKGVLVTGDDGQRAKSEWANFDVKANTIVMGGEVEITQNAKGAAPNKQQSLRLPDGMRFVINLTTGRYYTELEPGSASKTGGPQVSGAFATSSAPQPNASAVPFCPQGAVCKSHRPQLLIYPNQLEKSKGAEDPSTDARKTKSKKKPRDGQPAGDASSWSATTSPRER